MIKLDDDLWLAIAEAAARIGRTPRTIKVWRAQGEITVIVRRVGESQLLAAEQRARTCTLSGKRHDMSKPSAHVRGKLRLRDTALRPDPTRSSLSHAREPDRI